MVQVLTQTKIDRPRDVVAAFAADPDHAPVWYASIVAVEWKTPKPLAVGTRVGFEARFLGRRMAYTYEVAIHQPGHKLVMRSTEGPFPMETCYAWQATADGGTRMTLRNSGEPAGVLRLLRPLVEIMMRRANRKDLARLKRHLEKE
jgi:hypothetical protein